MWETELRTARDQRRLVRVFYKPTPGSEPIERNVEVLAVHHPYVSGYCHLRQDIRTFRMDRLVLVVPLEEHFFWDQRLRMIAVRCIEDLAMEPLEGRVEM